jgi:hypothetical protein
MPITITHNKTNTVTNWTQAQLDAQIALGNFAPGTLLADIVLPSDWNDNHIVTGAVESVNGQTGTVVLASDPNLTILGTGVSGDEFRYNEPVIVVSSSTVFLDDTMIYYTFTTDGVTNFDFDYSGITINDFTFKVFVSNRNPAQITIPVLSDLWIGGYQYVVSIRTAQRGASATVRFQNGRTNITNLCGNWEGN